MNEGWPVSDTSAVDIDFDGDRVEDPDEDLGIRSAVRLAFGGAPPGGVLGARDIARGRWSSPSGVAAEATPSTLDELADLIAADIAAGEKVAELAEKYRSRFVAFRLVRGDSQPISMLRRFKEFLREHVDERLIGMGAMPERMRRGRETGGQKRREKPLLEHRAQIEDSGGSSNGNG